MWYVPHPPRIIVLSTFLADPQVEGHEGAPAVSSWPPLFLTSPSQMRMIIGGAVAVIIIIIVVSIVKTVNKK
jgi:hypothetical protein